LVEGLLRDTVALGLDERVSGGLTRSTETYRRYITLRKQLIPLHLQAMSHDPRLQRALVQPDAARLKVFLEEQAELVTDADQGVALLVLRPGSGDPQGRAAPPLPEGSVLGEVVLDRRALYPPQAWQPKVAWAPVEAADGAPWRLEVTYVIPHALIQDYKALGDTARTFEHLDDRQTTLTEGYLKTFWAFSLASLLVTLVLGVWLARATTRRVSALAEGTARVARGDLSVKLPVEGGDELAQLTASFNAMVVELRQNRDRLAYLERVSTWQEIARRLAHEIKNPLTPILLAVQQLDRKFDAMRHQPDRYRGLVTDAVEIVTEEVGALRTLVQEFSEFARLPQVQPRPVELGAYVCELLKTNPQFDGLVTLCLPHEPLWVQLDPVLMRRALLNLLQNAKEASPPPPNPEEPSPIIALRVGVEHDKALVEVEDHGQGIPPDHLAKIFDPYFTTKEHGTGLGLAIVKKIILDHLGDIAAASPPPPSSLAPEPPFTGSSAAAGARFSVRLPRSPAPTASPPPPPSEAPSP
jgi:nitrogen fixation/metabolism regulation signal transduction histidine kinase